MPDPNKILQHPLCDDLEYCLVKLTLLSPGTTLATLAIYTFRFMSRTAGSIQEMAFSQHSFGQEL